MLEVKNLTKVYRPKKGKAVTALNKVSLKFEETGMVFILGKSGSGKSTLLNLMGGLDSITSGNIIIKGKSSEDFSQGDFDSYRNTYLGFIFQEYNIMNEFTVGENIGLALRLQGRPADAEAVEKILKEVDLEGYAARKPYELSGGQKQRVAIARALIKDPKIIMADEPTGALDSNTGRQVFETLQKLSKEKLVIIVSHDREYAEYYGDRVIEFKDGKVISDIYKYKAPSETLFGGGATITDGKIIQIKKGHKFKTDEREKILKFLENAQGDLIISADSRANQDFQKNTRIDADGNRDSFKETAESELKIKAYNPSDFNLRRSKLPSSHAFRIGASSLRAKPIRLIITILLAVVAFTLFGLADTLGSYNKVTATLNSLRASNIDNVALSKSLVWRDEGMDWENSRNVRMKKEDIDALNSKFPNTKFTALRYLESSSFSSNIGQSGGGSSYGRDPYYMSGFNGFIEFDSAVGVTDLGFTLIPGSTYPKDETEIAITRYAAETFLQSGTKHIDTSVSPNVYQDITAESQLLNKKLQLGQEQYTITAIIDTRFDSARYASLKNFDYSNAGIADYMLMSELQSLSQFSYHGSLFVGKGFADSLAESGESDWYNLEKFEIREYPMFNSTWDHTTLGLVGFYKDSMYDEVNVFDSSIITGADEITLADNQIIITQYMLQIIYDGNNQLSNLADSIRRSETAVHDYFKDHLFAQLKTEFKNYLIGKGVSSSTANTLATFNNFWKLFNSEQVSYTATRSEPRSVSGWGYDSAPFGPSLSVIEGLAGSDPSDMKEFAGIAFESELKDDYINYMITSAGVKQSYAEGLATFENYWKNMNFETVDYDEIIPYDAFLDGWPLRMAPFGPTYYEVQEMLVQQAITNWVSELDLSFRLTFGYGPSAVHKNYTIVGVHQDNSIGALFSENEFNSLFKEQGDIVCAMLIVPSSADDALDIIEFSYTETNGVKYEMQSAVSSTLGQVNSMIESMATVFLYIGIGFAVFAALMMLNFITVSISYKRKEIGILRAIGARSGDVFRIFFFESLVITVINAILAIVGTVVGCMIINGEILNMGLLITILNFGIRQIVLIFAIGVLTAFVASFFPVYKFARKKPVDAMKR